MPTRYHNIRPSEFEHEESHTISKGHGQLRRVLGQIALWAAYLCLGVLLVLSIVVTIRMSKKSPRQPGTTDFDLYKNSRFDECMNATPAAVDCAIIQQNMTDSNAKNDLGWRWLKDRRNFLNGDGAAGSPTGEYDWCSVASCLKDFKVIPSKPLNAAYGYSGIVVWTDILMTIISGLHVADKVFPRKPCPRHISQHGRCKGFELSDYIAAAYFLISTVTWWYSFISMTVKPQDNTPVSIFAFASVWQFALGLSFHPYSCKFNTERGGSKRWLVYCSVGLAILQWGATIYTLKLKGADIVVAGPPAQSGTVLHYQCLESDIKSSPGTSLCSPQDLCAKSWMFGNAYYNATTGVYTPNPVTGWGFIAPTIMILCFMLFSFLFTSCGTALNFDTSDFFGKVGVGISSIFPYAILFGIVFWYSVIVLKSHFGSGTLEMNADTAVAYDLQCRAVHVSLSPWKYYLDVGDEYNTWRVVRSYLNV